MTSVRTHWKKLTAVLSQILSKVTVTSCSFYITCSVCSPCCWTMHSSRRYYWPIAWSVKCCNSLPHWLDISQGSVVVTHLRCGEIFSDSIITNFLPDFDWEIIVKISKYLLKLTHTKNAAKFLGHPVCFYTHITGAWRLTWAASLGSWANSATD